MRTTATATSDLLGGPSGFAQLRRPASSVGTRGVVHEQAEPLVELDAVSLAVADDDDPGLRIHEDLLAEVALRREAVVIGFMRVVLRATGAAYETDFVYLIEVRDGRVVRFHEFFDTWTAAQALLGVPVRSS
jgi:hypothetical protein